MWMEDLTGKRAVAQPLLVWGQGISVHKGAWQWVSGCNLKSWPLKKAVEKNKCSIQWL